MGLPIPAAPSPQRADASPAPILIDLPSEAIVQARKTIRPAKDLTTGQRAQKNERLRFCREVWRLLESGSTQAEAVAAVATRADEFPLLAHAGKHNSSALTLRNYRNWIRKLGTDHSGRPRFENAVQLANRRGSNIRARSGNPLFWQLVNRFFLNQNKLSLSESYRLARQLAVRQGIAELPSERQVRYWFKTYADPAAVIVAREGEKYARDNVIGHILRDWSAVQVAQLWYGDHHQFDAPCRIWDETPGKWRAVRPWLTAWQDAKSYYFTGWLIRAGEHPDSLAIEDALLMGIRANGNRPPVVLAIDNGKDYLSNGFVSPVCLDGEHEHSICIELGCQYTNALPYNARSKLIERQFGTVCDQFSRLWPAYLGNCPNNRPQDAQKYWDKPEELPTLQQFCTAFATWLQTVYHAAATDSRVTGGKPPAKAWATRPELTNQLSDEELFFAFLKPVSQPRTVGRGAVIKLANRWFQSDALWPHFNEKVLVKVDRFQGRVYAFTLNGKLICECLPPNLVPGRAVTESDRKLLSNEQRKYRKQMTRARTIAQGLRGGEIKAVAPMDRLELLPAGAGVAPAPPYIAAPDDARMVDDNEPLDPKLRAELEDFEAIVFGGGPRGIAAKQEDVISEERLAALEAIIKEADHQRWEEKTQRWEAAHGSSGW